MKSKQRYAFISYSSKNQQSADAVRMLLADDNIKSWMAPYDIPAGSKYAHVINDAIEGCNCFILLLTEESQASEFVEKEVERAITYKKPIIPLQLGNIILNSGFKFYLGNSQIIAMTDINADSEEWIKAISAVKSFVFFQETQEIQKISSIDNEYRKEYFNIEEGTFGKTISWKLELNGDLYINGSGELNCATVYGQTLDTAMVDSLLKKIKEHVIRVFIGDGIEIIGDFSFYQFPNLSEVYVAYTVKKIGAGAFKDCFNLCHVEFPWQLEEIGLSAFQNCYSLENFELPDKVIISSVAFKNCRSLTRLEKKFNKGITIFQNAFEACTSLKQIVLDNVNMIGSYAFKGCSLEYVDLSFQKDGLVKSDQTLQNAAFALSDAKEVHLRFSSMIKLTALSYEIEDNCFAGCDGLTDVFFEEAIPYISGRAFPNNQKIRVHIKKGKYNDRIINKIFGEKCQVQYL